MRETHPCDFVLYCAKYLKQATMKPQTRAAVFVGVVLFFVFVGYWLPANAAGSDVSRPRYLWNSGTDLNGPNKRVLIEIPLQGKAVGTFKVLITYAYGGGGWIAFMNLGNYLELPNTGGAVSSASFVVLPEFVNRDGTQNVSIRGTNTAQGLHLYSIEVVPVSEAK